jgi:hypothetical protein
MSDTIQKRRRTQTACVGGSLVSPYETEETQHPQSLPRAVHSIVQHEFKNVDNQDSPLLHENINSRLAVELRNKLQAAMQTNLPVTMVFDHPTVRQLAEFMRHQKRAASVGIWTVSRRASASVSIDGTSVLQSSHPSPMRHTFWACGGDTIVQVPTARWRVRAETSTPSEPVASRVRHGAFMRGAELADNAWFGISVAESSAMDPCQRLLLERGYAALHDAGHTSHSLSSSLTGVFLGCVGGEYARLLATAPAGGSAYAATCAATAIAAGRLSYALGLHGPCAAYDTSCSAALTACHAGLRALQIEECTAGLVIGVALMLTPDVSTPRLKPESCSVGAEPLVV